ncbi:hypothetical protein ACFZC5_27665 [Nocardia gamkensis]|uniref:hypothetical protein n=1 Tax=Nocardia gamkensis TaxID=352869 RepID=UPI0036EDF835
MRVLGIAYSTYYWWCKRLERHSARLDFPYLHGGSVRQSGQSRYQQWVTQARHTVRPDPFPAGNDSLPGGHDLWCMRVLAVVGL